MEITEIESFAVSIPLDEPVAFVTRVVEERDHAVVRIRTADGTEGVGYTLGYGGATLVADAVADVLAPMIEGEDPRDTTRHWWEMFDGTVQIRRKSVLLRAISVVDIALWDITAKASGEPLYKLLGAVENGLWAEYFYRDSDVKAFDDVLERPMEPDGEGMLNVPDRPGHGITFDECALASYLVER